MILTRNRCAIHECLVNLWVQLNEHVALERHILVPVLDRLLYEVAKGGTQDRVRHVDDPLLGQLANLGLLGIVWECLWVLPNEGIQLLHGQALVLWDLQVFALVIFNDYKNRELDK